MPTDAPDRMTAQPFVPAEPTLPKLRAAAAQCTGCDLYRRATQTVFGEGPAHALALLIGEQPGDQEDLQGRPFVGPAGRMLDRALTEVGLNRERVYITNAVKHFSWTPAGKRRLHKKPSLREIRACRPWLEAELQVVKPQVIICLGATGAQALLGPKFRVTRHRGQILQYDDLPPIVATVHPSALLRIPDSDRRQQAYQAFLNDLRQACTQIDAAP